MSAAPEPVNVTKAKGIADSNTSFDAAVSRQDGQLAAFMIQLCT